MISTPTATPTATPTVTMPAPRVLLVSLPWRTPYASCLSLGLLAAQLQREGIPTRTLDGTLQFPRSRRPSTRCTLRFDAFSSALFLPALYPDADRDALCAAAFERFQSETLLSDPVLTDRAGTLAHLRADMALADRCLARCIAIAQQPDVDVVGLSLTFESQVGATFAFARALKAARPALPIVLGGAACLGEQAAAFLRSFASIDAVCHSEGDHVIAPLVRALHAGASLAEVPGVVYRGPDGAVARNPAPPLADLDALPLPRYEDYFAQHAASAWANGVPSLYFETSRGCWWGQKKPCLFCGLNAYGRTFRSKSPERAFREIRTLHERYPQARTLVATDNVLPPRYLKRLFPRLAALRRETPRPLRLFFDVRPTLRPAQLETLAAGGVVSVLPGIESFHDDILALMNKGSSLLENVQVLRGAFERGIEPLYNVLIANPGETAAAYDEMTALVPAICHLPAPGLQRMSLARFSRWYAAPEAHGITNIRPHPYYETLYRDPEMDREGLAFHFAYDHPMFDDPAHRAAHQAFVAAVDRWARDWRPDRAFYLDAGERLIVVDRRGSAGARRTVVTGADGALFRLLSDIRAFTTLCERLPWADPLVLRARLSEWEARRWVLRDRRDRYLNVLPRRGGAVRSGAAA